MTIAECVDAALKRAKWCKSRRKKTTHHYREAALTGGYALALEMQKQGKSYKRSLLAVLAKPTKGVRAMAREQQGSLF